MTFRKALLVLAPSAELDASGSGVEKLLKKSALFINYTAGNVFDGSVDEQSITRVQVADVGAVLEKGTALCVVDLPKASAADLDAALILLLDAIDRKTILAVVTQNALALYGSGINAKAGSLVRSAVAKDILPTLAYITDFPITNVCEGAILYQALKTPNLKREEIAKLQEALIRMEGALARDNREPWDKHDCA